MTPDSELTFQGAVVGIKIAVPNRPALLKFTIRQAQGDPAPSEAAATHLTTSNPEERLISRRAVRISTLVSKQIRVVLPVTRVLALAAVPAGTEMLQASEHVARLRAQGAADTQGRTGFKYEHLQPLLSKGLSRHRSGGTTPHDQSVIGAGRIERSSQGLQAVTPDAAASRAGHYSP